jgi:hypothetical protein
MRISFRPGVTWSISGGNAAFVGDPADLSNGQPASACRISWRTDSAQIADTVVLTGDLDEPIDAGVAALLMPRFSTESVIPAGVKVTFSGAMVTSAGSTPVALGGNSLTGRTVLHPNGATRRPCVFPAVSINQIIITIYNDKNGATWAAPGKYVDIGEAWVGDSSDWGVKQDLKIQLQGGLLQRKSHQNQNWPWAVKAYQAPSFNITPMNEAQALGPRTDQDDFQTVMHKMAQAQSIVLIPSYLSRNNNGNHHAPPAVISASAISEQRLCRTFMIGNLDGPIELDGDNNEFFVSPFTFGESPP